MVQQFLVSVGIVGVTRTTAWLQDGERTRNRPLQWIPDRAKRLAAAKAVQGETWSRAEVCDHLTLAFESTVRSNGESS
jgi:hypothetical protein